MFYPYTVENVMLAGTKRGRISSEPRRGNTGNNPVIIHGWCGTTNDIHVQALGEFATRAEAEAALHANGMRWFNVEREEYHPFGCVRRTEFETWKRLTKTGLR